MTIYPTLYLLPAGAGGLCGACHPKKAFLELLYVSSNLFVFIIYLSFPCLRLWSRHVNFVFVLSSHTSYNFCTPSVVLVCSDKTHSYPPKLRDVWVNPEFRMSLIRSCADARQRDVKTNRTSAIPECQMTLIPCRGSMLRLTIRVHFDCNMRTQVLKCGTLLRHMTRRAMLLLQLGTRLISNHQMRQLYGTSAPHRYFACFKNENPWLVSWSSYLADTARKLSINLELRTKNTGTKIQICECTWSIKVIWPRNKNLMISFFWNVLCTNRPQPSKSRHDRYTPYDEGEWRPSRRRIRWKLEDLPTEINGNTLRAFKCRCDHMATSRPGLHYQRPPKILKPGFAEVFPQDQVHQLYQEAESMELLPCQSWFWDWRLFSRVFPTWKWGFVHPNVLQERPCEVRCICQVQWQEEE